MYTTVKRLLVGPAVSLREEEAQKLGKPTALAVFSSDAISSTAYATDQILLVLLPAAGLAAFNYLVPISLVVVFLLFVVGASYRQTIFAYPGGGGSYVVSRENLGQNAGLVAGASLMVDYVLTVSVSVSSGVAAFIAAAPSLATYRVELCVATIAVMALANLRGLRTSGKAFAGPTYAYIAMLGLLLGIGAVRAATGTLPAASIPDDDAALAQAGIDVYALAGVSFIVILRAFSSGAVALTGVEAISNGVPAFRSPRRRNAAATLVIMASILGLGFFGVSALATRLKPIPSETTTVLSSMGETIFGGRSPLFYVLQFATLAILTLAANTSFADFPRVSSIMARDHFLPRQLADRGDRLVYSNGVILLAFVAGLLIVAFGGNTDKLVPLYAIGVFCAFTLSQSGMVRHHLRERERLWRVRLGINGLGAVTTFVVLWVVGVSKFTEGAWIPVVVIPLLVLVFRAIHRHYDRVDDELEIPEGFGVPPHPNVAVVVFEYLHVGVLEALSYAQTLGGHLMAVAVVADDDAAARVDQEWTRRGLPGTLKVLVSPTADIADPVMGVVDELQQMHPDAVVTVVLPEYVLHHWYEQTLHNQSVVMLRARLRLRPRVVIAAVPVSVPRKREHTTVAAAESGPRGSSP